MIHRLRGAVLATGIGDVSQCFVLGLSSSMAGACDLTVPQLNDDRSTLHRHNLLAILRLRIRSIIDNAGYYMHSVGLQRILGARRCKLASSQEYAVRYRCSAYSRGRPTWRGANLQHCSTVSYARQGWRCCVNPSSCTAATRLYTHFGSSSKTTTKCIGRELGCGRNVVGLRSFRAVLKQSRAFARHPSQVSMPIGR